MVILLFCQYGTNPTTGNAVMAPEIAEALKRIEAATKLGRSELSFDGLGLKTIPKEIAQLATLKTLNLRSNQLTALPAEVGRLTALTDLLSFRKPGSCKELQQDAG